MTDLDKSKYTRESDLDAAFVALCRKVEAKRPRTVIDHILKHGFITTEELNSLYGYDHPPRAARDVRENGIPLITHRVTSPKTGRRMGAYTFGDLSKVKRGRIGGRKAFSKKFREELLELYGSQDAITGAKMEGRYLQIDHRIPYEVAGDDSGKLKAEDFMLLDASSNRAKSWSCEHCNNFQKHHDPEICKQCFWAFPEDYSHIAGTPTRRLDIVWSADEVTDYEKLKSAADKEGVDLASYVKGLLAK